MKKRLLKIELAAEHHKGAKLLHAHNTVELNQKAESYLRAYGLFVMMMTVKCLSHLPNQDQHMSHETFPCNA